MIRPAGAGRWKWIAAVVVIAALALVIEQMVGGILEAAPSLVTPAVRAGTAPIANVWVSPSGNDSSAGCARSRSPVVMPATSTVCASLGRAYGLAAAGDVVGVATGDDPSQTICRDGAACAANLTKGPPSITIRCAARLMCTIDGSLFLGSDNGSATGSAPSHLVLDGLVVANGKLIVWGSSGVPDKGSHITFENGHVWDLASRSQTAPSDPGNDYGAIQFIQQNHVAVVNTEIGPVCCSSDGINQGSIDPYTARDYTISGNYIHDLYDSCAAVPAALLTAYGPCTGYGGDEVSGAHINGNQLWGGISGVAITRNRIYSVGNTGDSTGQGIYIERDPTSLGNVTFANILIANNMIDMGAVATNAISFVPNGGTLGATGYLKILYNTIWASGGSQYGNIRIYNNFMAPGTTVVVAGNIAKNYDTEDNSCSATAQGGSDLAIVYSHNLFGNRRCSESDITGEPVFVSVSESAPDLHLARQQRAVGGGESTYCPRVDIDGTRRPAGVRCDIGADEWALPKAKR